MSINDDILYKIDSEIGKDKKVVELQREIERLNQEIRCLNNCIIEFHSEFCNKQTEINSLNNIIKNTIKELFELKDLIYKPETREINFDVQRKISSIIVKLGSDKE